MEYRINKYAVKVNKRNQPTSGALDMQSTVNPFISGSHSSVMHIPTYPPVKLDTDGAGYGIKRIVDIMGAGLGLLGLGLIFPFVYAGIKLSAKGPVLFLQPRYGKNGEVFLCYKFRTMTPKNEIPRSIKPDVTKVDDKRIFAFGEFLRKTNLDELPQLINVLRGEMSLVGPRPLPVRECRYWRSIIPGFSMRYRNTRPGLTGWAQVTGYRGGNLDPVHMYYRLKRDLAYIENASLRLDLEIIWRTVKKMVTSNTGAH